MDNNGYTIRYEVLDAVHTVFVIAPTAAQALAEGKAQVSQMLTPEQRYPHPVWHPTIMRVDHAPLCPYCAHHAYRKCQHCETLMCGTCGGLEPICQECYCKAPTPRAADER